MATRNYLRGLHLWLTLYLELGSSNKKLDPGVYSDLFILFGTRLRTEDVTREETASP